MDPLLIHLQDTELGWLAIAGREHTATHLVLGHASRSAAWQAIRARVGAPCQQAAWCEELAARLADYAAGRPVDPLPPGWACDPGPLTPFQRMVVACCRRIPYGRTATYGELARRAGRGGAARAVGNVMAANRLPLLVPCHRVVASGGRLGGFSAPQGIGLKRRLLALEAAASGLGHLVDEPPGAPCGAGAASRQ